MTLAPEPKLNHQANIVRITDIHPHTNADNLVLIGIGSYQCVARKGDFLPGDLAVHIQPDSVVPQTEPFRFIWEQHMTGTVADPACVLNHHVPEKKRRITVRKFRGEWSEGLLLPLAEFEEDIRLAVENLGGKIILEPGTDLSDIIGVTHYNPESEPSKLESTYAPRFKWPKTFRGWFYFVLHRLGFQRATSGYALEVGFHLPTYDVDSIKNFPNTLQEGESVVVTEKIHGSNARFIFLDDVMYRGSRSQWKAPGGSDVWNKVLVQHPWIETWCREYPGAALYGEVTPTQKGFDYGCKSGEVKFFLFDIRTPQGKWVPVSQWPEWGFPGRSEYKMVPLYYEGPYKKELVHKLADGYSMVPGAKHVREGVVIKAVTEQYGHRVQLKLVSNRFLESDSKL